MQGANLGTLSVAQIVHNMNSIYAQMDNISKKMDILFENNLARDITGSMKICGELVEQLHTTKII